MIRKIDDIPSPEERFQSLLPTIQICTLCHSKSLIEFVDDLKYSNTSFHGEHLAWVCPYCHHSVVFSTDQLDVLAYLSLKPYARWVDWIFLMVFVLVFMIMLIFAIH
jgi:hypothetical protein